MNNTESISNNSPTYIKSLLNKYALWPELNHDYQKNISFGDISLEEFKKTLNIIGNDKVILENDLALFYLQNSDLSEKRNEQQGLLDEASIKDYESYQNTLGDVSKNLLAYIFICCIVEARHSILFYNLKYSYFGFLEELAEDEKNKELLNSFEEIQFKEQLADCITTKEVYDKLKTNKLGRRFLDFKLYDFKNDDETPEEAEKFINFLVLIREEVSNYMGNTKDRHTSYSNVYENIFDLLKDYTLEEVFKNLTRTFSLNIFRSNYGGKPWFDISKHGQDFVTGEINAEMFIDQAFSLEHNSGTMFNKDFLYQPLEPFNIVVHEQYGERRKEYVKTSMTQLILTAQHMSVLPALFSLDKVLPYLSKYIDLQSLYSLYDSFSSYNSDSNYNFDLFQEHYIDAVKHLSIINETLEPIKESIKLLQPNLFTNEFKPCDFKKLFYGLSQTRIVDGSYYNLEKGTTSDNPRNKGGFYDLLNFLHNNVAGYQLQNNVNYIIQEEDVITSSESSLQTSFNPQVFNIKTIGNEFIDKNIIGGKGWGLVNMVNQDLPVPDAFIFNTDFCHSYLLNKSNDAISNIHNLIAEKMKSILPQFSKNNQFGDFTMYSIRSGSPVSMPGMMDTILNVGIDNSNYHHFREKMGNKVVESCILKFMELFCSSRLDIKIDFTSEGLYFALSKFRNILNENGIETEPPTDRIFNFPLTKEKQIEESLYAVFNSWHSERAKAYRNEKGISHDLGTAAIIQEMVFGNLNDNSCTGVVFSRNCLTGENTLVGEYLPNAQGEDVVSGSRTPYDIKKLQILYPDIYNQLFDIAKQLENQTKQIQDIEFTVEDGKLYILQHRQAVCSPVAALNFLKNYNTNQETDILDKNSLLKQINTSVFQPTYCVDSQLECDYSGISANNGIVRGIIVENIFDMEALQETLDKTREQYPDCGWIFYSELTSPEHMPIMRKTQGFITEQGGFTSHAAIISRSLNKPCIVGLGGSYADKFEAGDMVTMDGSTGKIWKSIENIVYNQESAIEAVNTIIASQNIDVQSLNNTIEKNQDFKKAWMLELTNAKIINNAPVKKDKFFDLSAKIAMVITKESQFTDSSIIKDINKRNNLIEENIILSEEIEPFNFKKRSLS